MVLGRLGKYEEAIKFYNEELKMNPNYSKAWYNKACALSLMKNKNEMHINLKRAIELDKKYKEKASKDEDFKCYCNDPDFMELVK